MAYSTKNHAVCFHLMARKILRPVVYVLLGILFSSAQADWLFPAKYAGEFLATGVGARALGMGGAHAALAVDVTAGYWNPAGLSHLSRRQVMLMHSEGFAGIVKYDYLAFAQPFRQNEGVALSLVALGVGDIPITALEDPNSPIGPDNRVIETETSNDLEMALLVSYGKQAIHGIDLGANAKIIHKGVAHHSAWGLGFDVAARTQLPGKVLVGATVQDITTTLLVWDTGHKESLTPTVKLGLARMFAIPKLGAEITPVADGDFRFDNRRGADDAYWGTISMIGHVGMEFRLERTVALRAGVDGGRLTAGAGLSLYGVEADYAYLSHEDLGDSHRVSLGISWGKR
jgi:hypothetical protein